jgi:uncharacterized membrane protein YkoI
VLVILGGGQDMRYLLLSAMVFVVSFAVRAADTDLPDAAKKAFQDKYKDVKSYKVRTENEKGKTVYEVEFKDANGVKNEVELTADGTIVSEVHQIKIDDLPKAIKDAIQKAYPESSIKEAKIETENGATSYEVELKTKDGKKFEVESSADGSKLKVEDDDDKDEQDEKTEKSEKK